MPRLSEQDIRRFRDRIRIARRMEDDRKLHWERWLNYYRGKHDIRIEKPLDHVVVNMILPMVEVKTAAVTGRDPVWRFEASLREHEVREIVWQAVMPRVWYNIKAKHQIRASYKDRLIYGFGVVRTAYRYETDKDQFVDLTPGQLEKARAGQDPGLGFPAELLELQGRVVARNPNASILYDDVVIERISPRRFFPDPETDWQNVHMADWIDHQVVRPLEDVKRTKRYANPDKLTGDRQWEMQDRSSSRPLGSSSDDLPQDRARVTEHHVWDRKMEMYAIFAQERDDPLFVGEFPYQYMEGYPFETIGSYAVPDDLYPISDVQLVIPIQDEKNLVRSRAATRIRRLVDKYGIDVNAITDGTIEALESDAEGAIVRLGAPPSPSTLSLLESRGYPSDLLAHERNVDRDFTNLSRQPEYARGGAEQGVETATEANILREMSGVSGEDDQAQYDDFLARIGRKVKAIIEEFYDAPRVARISPEVARELQQAIQEAAMGGVALPQVEMSSRGAWIHFDRESLKMEGELMIEAGSTAFRNRVLEQKRLTEQFQPMWNHPLINQEELIKLYVTKATDLASERDRLIVPAQALIQAQQLAGQQPGASPNGELAPSGTEEGLTRAAAQLNRGQ